ncbi:hypothetical protein C0995_010746 [Termitomyces sp. Mi166|nr:hypothetical protein C0995_010746 [Termitomyces sp. Mi166\
MPCGPRIAIIGAGAGGLSFAIALKRKYGYQNFTRSLNGTIKKIFEKTDAVGGTWHENTYPVKIYIYQWKVTIKLILNKPDWTSSHPFQPEIQDYWDGLSKKYSLTPHIKFGTVVIKAVWDSNASCYHITFEDVETWTQSITSAEILVSALGVLEIPRSPDIPGLYDFEGTIFHSARWVDMKLDGKCVAVIGNGASATQFLPIIAKTPNIRITQFCRTPNWLFPPRHQTTNSEGEHLPFDVIILATGFRTDKYPLHIEGKSGQTIQDYYDSKGGPTAYMGTTVPGFPNLYMLGGPNTVTGHTSVIFTEEVQINYSLALIKPILDGRLSVVDAKHEATDRYNEVVQKKLSGSVFVGCNSWYRLSGTGKINTMFPGSAAHFWWWLRRPVWTDYEVTVARSDLKPLKGSIPVTTVLPTTPASASLRPLYNRAARAFLLRNIPLTQSLLESAFAQIDSPDVVPDPLAEQRRKWDILRITLETTVYSSPPPQETLPQSLKDLQLQSPHSLLTNLHERSLTLFAPKRDRSTAQSIYLPTQVLITLIYSSLRLDTPDFGRIIIEDWLSKRDVLPSGHEAEDSGAYEKVLELYCLQILPKLEQWDYAQEFLEYEGELPASSRENLIQSLRSLQAEAMSSCQSNNTSSLPPPQVDWSPRSSSPAPSTSSSSSSLSTTSTHTVVPATRSSLQPLSALTPLAPANASTTSLSSDSTATPQQTSRHPVLRSRTAADSKSTPFSSGPSALSRSPPQPAAVRSANLSIYAIVKASLAPYISTTNVSTIFLLFVVFPLVSLALRARHRRRQALNGSISTGNSAELVRQRLQTAGAGALSQAWNEMLRIVYDTVRMAGSGLV